jgi:tetratricopeptide (TPR) repeat protein
MYYLFLEIGSYRQLTKLQPDLISGLVSRLEDHAQRHGAVAAGAEGGRFLFRFPVLADDRHGPILDAAFDARDILAQSAEEIAGYSVVIDLIEDQRDSEVAARLRDFVLSAPSDEAIWLTGRASAALGPFVETAEHAGFTRIVERRDSSSEALGRATDFAVMADAVEEMRSRLAPWINGTDEPGVLLVYGDELQGVSENVHAAIAPLQNVVKRVFWPSVIGVREEHDPYRPLMRTISESDLSRAADYLTRSERELYETKLDFLRMLVRRPFAGGYHRLRPADVQSAYALFLTARLRHLRAELALPGVVVEGAHTLARETVAILTGALNVIEPAIRPVLVLTSTRDVLPVQLLGRDVSRYELPVLSADQFADRATTYLTEPARRRLRLAAGMARTGGRALAVYHHFSNLQEERDFEPLHASSREASVFADGFAALSRLPRDELEFLFIAGETRGCFDRGGLFRILGELGVERVRISEMSDDLVRRGFLRDEQSCLPRARSFAEHAEALLGERAQSLRSELARWVEAALAAGTLYPDRELAHVEWRAGKRVEAVNTVWQLLVRELDAGNLERAADLERDGVFEEEPGAHVEHRRRAAVYQLAATVRRLLMQEDLGESERLFGRLPDTGGNPELSGELSLQQARLMLMRGDLADAMRLAKRAVMSFQDAGRTDSTARAHLEFGLVLLGREQLSDARDYFLLVQGNTVVSPYTLARAELLGTVCLFLDGKYTRVLESVERHRQMLAPAGFESWLLYARFLEGRTLFDLGRYVDAAAVFHQGMAQARILDMPAAFRAYHLWAARCSVYQGSTRHAEAIFEAYEPDAELLYFRAEACHRDDRLQQALGHLDAAMESADAGYPLGGELFQWSGGFAAVEDLAIGRETGEPVLRNLIKAFRGYIMAHVGRLEAGMAEVHNLTRQQRLSGIDPYRAYYFYFYSVILQGSGPDRLDDPLTVLGKSVKNLRERTGRIDQYGHKTDYLYRNYWNRRLMDAAKAHNLL